MIELVKISENISRQFDGQETVDNLQAVNYRIVENGVEKGHVTVGQDKGPCGKNVQRIIRWQR